MSFPMVFLTLRRVLSDSPVALPLSLCNRKTKCAVFSFLPHPEKNSKHLPQLLKQFKSTWPFCHRKFSKMEPVLPLVANHGIETLKCHQVVNVYLRLQWTSQSLQRKLSYSVQESVMLYHCDNQECPWIKTSKNHHTRCRNRTQAKHKTQID